LENHVHLPTLFQPYQSLAVVLLVGLVAGWMAARFVTKYGMGIVGDIVVGVIGAYIGNWLASAWRSLWNRARSPQSECHGRRYRPALAGSFNPARLKRVSTFEGWPPRAAFPILRFWPSVAAA